MTWINSHRFGTLQTVREPTMEIANMARAATPSSRRRTAKKAAAGSSGPVRAAGATTRSKPARPRTSSARKAVATKRTGNAAAVEHRKALVPTPVSADSPRWTETLADGTHVLIRPLRKSDAELERSFIRRLSPEARRMRFLGQMSEPSDALIKSLTDLNPRRDVAFVALVHRDNEKREIGVSRFQTSADGRICECAVTVSDEWQKKGLGTLLMRHLIEVARSRGIRKMISIDAADNIPMRDLARFLGFGRQVDPQDPTEVIHVLTLE
jgi:GNAT superfamily N-acetyltransferase